MTSHEIMREKYLNAQLTKPKTTILDQIHSYNYNENNYLVKVIYPNEIKLYRNDGDFKDFFKTIINMSNKLIKTNSRLNKIYYYTRINLL